MGLIGAKQALFLRVVQLSSFDYIENREFSFNVLKGLTAVAPKTRHLAMTVHGTGFGLNAAQTVQAEVDGCRYAVMAREFPPALVRISIVDRDPAMVREFRAALTEVLPDHILETPFAAPAGDVTAVPEGGRDSRSSHTPLPESGEYDVFISYKSEDALSAQDVYDMLKGQGLRVFFSRESLPRLGSDEYHEQIDLAIEKSRHMVVVTTSGEHALSKWVNYEWRLFLGEKLAGRKAGNLVTVIAGDMTIEELPIGLRHREVIRLAPGERERLVGFLKASGAN
jgi:hypothetical protein